MIDEVLSTRIAGELAVSAIFDPTRLPAGDPAIRRLLDWYTVEVRGGNTPGARMLSESARVEALASTLRQGGAIALARLREHVTTHFDSTMQKMLDAYLKGKVPPLEEQTEDELAASLHVLRWTAGAHAQARSDAGPRPGEREAIEGRLRVLGVTRPILNLLKNGFVGRSTERERLRQFRLAPGGPLSARPALVIHGVGGMGKSTLVARFVQDLNEDAAKEGNPPAWAYLDFDRATLAPSSSSRGQPERRSRAQLVFDDIVRQVGAQYPALHSLLESSALQVNRNIDMSGLESFAHHERDDETAYRIGSLLREVLGNQKLVIVLDTFEEVERRDASAGGELYRALDKLSTVVSQLRLVVSGRAPAAAFRTTPEHELEIRELDQTGAREVLSLYYHQARAENGGGEPAQQPFPPIDIETAREVSEVVGRSPLTLRLAGEVLAVEGMEAIHDAGRRANVLYRIRNEFVRGFLYHRVLDHVRPGDVALTVPLRKVARAALALRKVDALAIERILLPAVGEASNPNLAALLYDALKNEVAIVGSTGGSDVLVLRRELREPALAALKLEDAALVRDVHERAVRLYEHTDAAELAYHELALGKGISDAVQELTPEVRDSLADYLADLPRGTAQVLSSVGMRRTAAFLDAREQAVWEKSILSSADTALRDGKLQEAERLLFEREHRSATSELYRLESRLYEARGELERAIEAAHKDMEASQAAEAPQRIAAAAVRLAKLEEWCDRGRAALSALVEIDATPALAGEWALRLELLLNRLALAERVQLETPDSRWEWGLEARGLLSRVSPVDHERHALVRLLAATLGRDERRYIRSAVEKVGLDPRASDATVAAAAEALWQWDARDQSQVDSALPGRVAAACGLNLQGAPYGAESWVTHLRTIGPQIGQVLNSELWEWSVPPSVLEGFRRYYLYQGFNRPTTVLHRSGDEPAVHPMTADTPLGANSTRELLELITTRYSANELTSLALRVGIQLASMTVETSASRWAYDLLSQVASIGLSAKLVKVVLDDAGPGPLANRIRTVIGADWLASAGLGGGIMSKLDVATTLAGTGIEPKPLVTYLESVPSLTVEEKTLLIEQALTLMEDLYVHLPLKRARYATDPVQRLKLLLYRMPSDRVFHEEMIDVFMSVRDLHTNYVLPDPYRYATAVLPFQIAEYYEQEKRRYIVFSTAGDDPDFRPGMPVTHWNGVPIERAVELNARRQAGGNEAAKHARGLQRMCVRPLVMSLPPDEEWVDVRYLDQNGAPHERRFSWVVVQQPPATAAAPETSAELASPHAMVQYAALGLDLENEIANAVIKKIFQQEQVKIEEDVLRLLRGGGLESTFGTPVDFNKVSKMPEVFTFETITTPDGAVGRIAIRTFAVDSPAAFVQEFVRIAGLLPEDGLIIDVRNNGGGNIIAGETLLQTLTDRSIEPERLHFINTPLTLAIARGTPDWFAKWIPSMETAVETGAVFSQGWPLLDVGEYNKIKRRYPGPVVLITNAFCYSTTDIFAAGFQDHKIGKIIGTDGNTGAGGANVFDWGLLKTLGDALPTNPIALPPKGSNFRVAIRRTTRVGDNSGLALEDAGVVPDVVHRLTLDDLIKKDTSLFAHAAKLLKS